MNYLTIDGIDYPIPAGCSYLLVSPEYYPFCKDLPNIQVEVDFRVGREHIVCLDSTYTPMYSLAIVQKTVLSPFHAAAEWDMTGWVYDIEGVPLLQLTPQGIKDLLNLRPEVIQRP